MTADTNEALDALVKRLRDPWSHSEDLCDEAADMLTAQAAKLAETEKALVLVAIERDLARKQMRELKIHARRLHRLLSWAHDNLPTGQDIDITRALVLYEKREKKKWR